MDKVADEFLLAKLQNTPKPATQKHVYICQSGNSQQMC